MAMCIFHAAREASEIRDLRWKRVMPPEIFTLATCNLPRYQRPIAFGQARVRIGLLAGFLHFPILELRLESFAFGSLANITICRPGWADVLRQKSVLGSAVTIFFDVKNGTGQWQFQVLSSFSSLILILIIGAIIRDLDALKAGEFGAIYRTVVLFAFSMGFFGATFGHYVKDVSKDFSEITSKNGTYDNAKVVMLLSHHVVFFSNGSVITIPTGDVVKITTSAKSTILMTH